MVASVSASIAPYFGFVSSAMLSKSLFEQFASIIWVSGLGPVFILVSVFATAICSFRFLIISGVQEDVFHFCIDQESFYYLSLNVINYYAQVFILPIIFIGNPFADIAFFRRLYFYMFWKNKA